MKKQITIALFVCALVSYQARSQGCAAIRNLAGFSQFSLPGYTDDPIKWFLVVNSRYSEFHDTYNEDQKLDIPEANKTSSHTFIVDFALTRNYENGWSFTIDVPLMTANRTNWGDHTSPADSITTKHTTSSFGLSDIRVTVYKWLLDVSEYHKGNIQVGLGLKLPTGDFRYQDYFYRASGRVVAPVNQTLQLGDGGTGITTEVNAYYTISSKFTVFANGFYLFNPRDQNGTSSTLGRTPPPALKEAGGDVNSVPDAFLLRGGANFTTGNFILWAGARFEGVPVYDAMGGSNGARRAGYGVSVEPGVNYRFKKSTIFAFVPVPIYKTLKQTVPDKNITNATGVYAPSPGGMVNYLIFVGAMFQI